MGKVTGSRSVWLVSCLIGLSLVSPSGRGDDPRLNMVIVMDRSGSMAGTSWEGAKSELSDFFSAQSSLGVNVGINFFPVDGALDQCDVLEYNPIQVPLGPLTSYAPTLIAEFNSQSPFGSTPTYAALFGSLQWATNYKDSSGQDVIVVLITDGSPTECNTSIADIASLANSAFNYNGVRTYAIAIQGATVSDLNFIAGQGGGQAYDVTSNILLLGAKMDEILVDALGEKELNVNITGSGSVLSDLPGIDCGVSCSSVYTTGAYVTLTAYPDPLWTLGSWTWSGACLGNSICNITMDTEKTVNAAFYCELVTIPEPPSPIDAPEPPWECFDLEALDGFEIVGPTGDVTFSAENSIKIGSGFKVGTGGRFKALVTP